MNTRDIQRINCLNKVSILTKRNICHSAQDINLCSVNATVTSALSGHPWEWLTDRSIQVNRLIQV